MKLSKALLAAAIAVPVLSVASHSLLAQDANSQDSGTMERADADMREVLVQLDSKRMIIEGSTTSTPDPTLLKLLVKAFDLHDKLLAGRGASLELIAGREDVNSSYATRLLRLAFLSPEIVRAILDGRHPPTLTARRLLLDSRLPLAWKDQLAAMS